MSYVFKIKHFKLLFNNKRSRAFYSVIFLLVFISSSITAFSQDDTQPNDTVYNKYSKPSAIAGISLLSYLGELNGKNEFNITTNINYGITLGVEYRWKKYLGFNLTGTYGSVLHEEKEMPLRNFYSSIINANLNGIFYFDNDFLLKHERGFSPIITIGAGLTFFNPMTDLKDKEGRKYYVWNDGSLRDRPRDPDDPHNGIVLFRDYEYETKIDSSGKNPTMAFTFPIGVGLKYKLSDFFEVAFQMSYHFSTTDLLEGYSDPERGTGIIKGNDALFYSGISLQYNFGAKAYKDPRDKLYENVNFAEIEKTDSDGDGVYDKDDRCPDTPTGVEVDGKGCPKDTDGDGVPDYRDKEPKSVAGAHVDAQGVTITEKTMYELFQWDSLLSLGFYPDSIKHRARRDTSRLVTFKDIAGYDAVDPYKNRQTQVKPAVNPNIPQNYIVAGENRNKNVNTNKANENLITDLFFTVQIATSENIVSDDYFYNKYGITDNVYIVEKGGGYKYYVGNFNTKQKATEYCQKLKKENKVVDAFVAQIPAGMVAKSLVVPEAVKVKPATNINTVPEIKEISEDQKGLIFRIQISSRATKLPPEYFLEKYNITDEVFVSYQDGAYKYSIGKFEKYEDAKKFNDEFKQTYGIMDSYVTPYLDGKRISVPEAIRLQNK